MVVNINLFVVQAWEVPPKCLSPPVGLANTRGFHTSAGNKNPWSDILPLVVGFNPFEKWYKLGSFPICRGDFFQKNETTT